MHPGQYIGTVALPCLRLVPRVILLDCHNLVVCVVVLHLVWFLLAHLLVLMLHVLVQLLRVLMLLIHIGVCVGRVV